MTAVPEQIAERIRRLPRAGLVWRAVAAGVVTVVMVGSMLAGSDDLFPFGPMTQYAFRTDPNGSIGSVRVEADTTAGVKHQHVELDAGGVGIARAEVEGQLSSFQQHPERLRIISDAQRALHPDQPQFTKVYLVQRRTQLRDRRPVGFKDVVLATWKVTR